MLILSLCNVLFERVWGQKRYWTVNKSYIPKRGTESNIAHEWGSFHKEKETNMPDEVIFLCVLTLPHNTFRFLHMAPLQIDLQKKHFQVELHENIVFSLTVYFQEKNHKLPSFAVAQFMNHCLLLKWKQILLEEISPDLSFCLGLLNTEAKQTFCFKML